jgi:hypothetical protein
MRAMMNRRSLFGFIAVAPVAVSTAIAAKPESIKPERIRIRIKGTLAGKPAYIEGRLADVRFLADDNEGATLASEIPDSIHRVEIYDDDGRSVSLRAWNIRA